MWLLFMKLKYVKVVFNLIKLKKTIHQNILHTLMLPFLNELYL